MTKKYIVNAAHRKRRNFREKLDTADERKQKVLIITSDIAVVCQGSFRILFSLTISVTFDLLVCF